MSNLMSIKQAFTDAGFREVAVHPNGPRYVRVDCWSGPDRRGVDNIDGDVGVGIAAMRKCFEAEGLIP